MPLLRSLRFLLAPVSLSLAACGGAATTSPESQPHAAPSAEPSPHADHGGPAEGGPVGEVHAHGHQHHFTDPAAYAQRWEGPERDAWQEPDRLVALLDVTPGMRVADIGTGTGYLLPWLVEAAGPEGTVLAIDVEDAMVEWVRARAEESGWTTVVPTLAPFEGPGVEPDSLDRAVMINVWHHIEDRATYAQNALAALTPGGVMLVVETRLDAPDGPPMHYRMAPETVVAELAEAGFEASVAPWENVRQYAVVARRPAEAP